MVSMVRRFAAVVGILLAIGLTTAEGAQKTHIKAYTKKDSTHVAAHDRKPKTAVARTTAPRDDRGRIQRSAAARHAFARQTGYPHGRPGYVIDHVVPLACGGADAPSNMQWQTTAEGKAKDRTERVGCR